MDQKCWCYPQVRQTAEWPRKPIPSFRDLPRCPTTVLSHIQLQWYHPDQSSWRLGRNPSVKLCQRELSVCHIHSYPEGESYQGQRGDVFQPQLGGVPGYIQYKYVLEEFLESCFYGYFTPEWEVCCLDLGKEVSVLWGTVPSWKKFVRMESLCWSVVGGGWGCPDYFE